jgi:hypothetical protein
VRSSSQGVTNVSDPTQSEEMLIPA